MTSDGRKKRSLFEDVSPGNVGNVFQVPPAQATVFSPASFGQPVRVLDIRGDDSLGDVICVSLQQETVLNLQDATTEEDQVPLEGPLVGIVEFGAGAGLSTFEFDIPSPVSWPGNVVSGPALGGTLFKRYLPVSRRANGILLQLPASSLRVFARNDAKAPYIVGAAGPVPPADSAMPINSLNPNGIGTIRVHATYGTRPDQSRLFRSYPICNGRAGALGTAPLLGGITGQGVAMGIPAYAKRVFFPRDPIETTTLQVIQTSSQNSSNFVGLMGTFTVPPGSLGAIDIMPSANSIIFSVPLASPDVLFLTVVFELAI